MSALIVDTSSWISYFRGKSLPRLDEALEAGIVFLSPVVIAELLSARLHVSQRKKLVEFLRELPLCKVEFQHWCAVGALRSQLLSNGLSVSTADAHIAQCSLEIDGLLMTEDKIFQKIASVIPLKVVS